MLRQLEDWKTIRKFVAANIKTAPILGADFFTVHSMSIDLGKRQLQWSSHIVELAVTSCPVRCEVRLTENVSLHGAHRISTAASVINREVPDAKPKHSCIIEP